MWPKIKMALPAWGWLFHVISPLYIGVISGPYWNNWVTLGPLHKCLKFIWVVVSNIWIMFTPIWGRWTQFEEHIFSDGLKPPTSPRFSGWYFTPYETPISLNGIFRPGAVNKMSLHWFTPQCLTCSPPEKWWFEDYFPFGMAEFSGANC